MAASLLLCILCEARFERKEACFSAAMKKYMLQNE